MNSSPFVPPRTLVVRRPDAPRAGIARVPGDGSISHRAPMFAGPAAGEARIEGLPAWWCRRSESRGMIDGHPVLAVAAAFAAGETRSCSLVKRRVQEGARLAATVALLHATEGPVRVDDDMIVNGGHADDLRRRAGAGSDATQAGDGRRDDGAGGAPSDQRWAAWALVGPVNRLGAGPAEPGA